MAFQRHGVKTSMMPPTQSGFQHHNPNKEIGPLTQIARGYATDKVIEQADKAVDPAIKQVMSKGKSLLTGASAAVAPSALQTAALQTAAAAAPAGLGIAPGAAAAITGSAGTGAALGGSTLAGLGGAATGGAMTAAAPMLTALGPIGLAIGGGMLASQLLKGDKSHIQHLNQGNKVQMPLLYGKEAVEAERMAELERLRQAWLNRNRPTTTGEIPNIGLHFSREQPAPESYNFPTERIDDVRISGGPLDMIGPLSPYSNEDAKIQLELALEQTKVNREEDRKDNLNNAKIEKIKAETKPMYPMSPLGGVDSIARSNLIDSFMDTKDGRDLALFNQSQYEDYYAPHLAIPVIQESKFNAPEISIIPEGRPMMNMSEEEVSDASSMPSKVNTMPLLDGREAEEAKRMAELERLRAEYLAKNNLNKNDGGPIGYNHGGPLGRSQMMTPQAKAQAKAYKDYKNADSQLRKYYAKQMVRSFPSEAPLSLMERVVDPIKARTPFYRFTDYGKIKLDN